MVVNDFNLMGIPCVPDKADPPLIVDADAVLPGAVALQGFQAVPRWNAQIVQGNSVVQNFELLHGNPLHVRREGHNPEAVKQFLGPFVPVTHYHMKNMTRKTYEGKPVLPRPAGSVIL